MDHKEAVNGIKAAKETLRKTLRVRQPKGTWTGIREDILAAQSPEVLQKLERAYIRPRNKTSDLT